MEGGGGLLVLALGLWAPVLLSPGWKHFFRAVFVSIETDSKMGMLLNRKGAVLFHEKAVLFFSTKILVGIRLLRPYKSATPLL